MHMACSWNINLKHKPDSETGTILCKCYDCGHYADLQADRDYETGRLVVHVMTCKGRGGHITTREQP